MKNAPDDSNSISLRDIYLKALDKQSPEAREAYLEGACGDNISLRDKVEALLRENAEDSFLEAPAIEKGETLASGPTELPGTVIGRYKILQSIGEGGFGSVYMAEQKEPVKRRVALKIIKLGMDTKQVVARFEAERQALAMMDHPNIAKVLDAGSTDAGRPYFVMELVRGISITKYCDENHLRANDRLQLFMHVCSAIQHAHQKGVIHRDIKPSNIMITLHDGQPVPKVIDFGIAKATQQELTEKTLFTQYSQFIGTPAYMSPEQAEMSGLDVDTRSDIYSLGVLLYELLTGRTPLDREELMSGGYEEIRRRIREEEPSKPSTRVSTMVGEERTNVGKHLATDPAKLSHLLKGDLDWVVMKALEKDRTRRYETANALKMDIERFLINEPVTAVKPSASYILGKYMRRHKTVVGFAAVIAILLIAATVISGFFAIKTSRAIESETSAKEEAMESQKIATDEKKRAELALIEANEQKQRATKLSESLKSQLYGVNMERAIDAVNEFSGTQAAAFLEQCDPALRGWEWEHLQLQTDQSYRTLSRAPFQINGLEVSPDGRYLLVDTVNQDPVVYDLLNPEVVHESNIGTSDEYSNSTWHPNQEWIASPDIGGIQLWHPKKMGPRLEGDFKDTERLLFSNDGAYLFVSHYSEPSGALSIWDMKEQKRIEHLVTAYSSPLTRPCVSPNGKWLAAAARNTGNILVWDLQNLASDKKPRVLSPAQATPVMSLQFSPDGQHLVAGFINGIIFAYDIRDAWRGLRAIDVIDVSAHEQGVWDLVFNHDGSLMAATVGTGIILYRGDGVKLGTLLGHQGVIECADFTPDGKTLITGDNLGFIKFWNIQHPKGALKLTGHGGEDHRELQFSPDGKHLATTGNNYGDVRIWDVHTGALLHTFAKEATSDGIHWEQPVALDYSPDGQWLAVGDFASTNSCIIEVKTGKVVKRLKSPMKMVYLDFHPDGFRLAGASKAGEVILWSDQSEEPPLNIQTRDYFPYKGAYAEDPELIDGLAFSPEGQFLGLTFFQGSVALLDGTTGKLLKQTSKDVKAHRDVNFSPTEPLIAAGLVDGQILLWSYLTEEEPVKLPGHRGAVLSIDFSPDGKRLVSSDSAGSVLIWDVQNKRVIGELMSEDHRLWGVDFSPDGSSIAAVGNRGIIHILESKPVSDEIAKLRLENFLQAQ